MTGDFFCGILFIIKIKNMEETILERSRAKSMALGIILQLVAGYCIAIGIWGLALNKSLFWFVLVGVIVGLLIGLFNAKIILIQRTVEGASDMMFSMGSLWGGLCTIIGIFGLIVWIIRVIFFH